MTKNNKLEAQEQRRHDLQRSLDAAKTQVERNRLGQFSTPAGLAIDILSYARKHLHCSYPVRFLDPAIGTGSFYSALNQIFPEQLIISAKGFEIDPHYAVSAVELWQGTDLSIEQADFTKLDFPPNEERYNLIICNPPYVRHHHIINGEKVRIQHKTLQASGVRVGGLAGLYCYFLGLSHAWMEEGGLAGWLIPSEFMDVNYGKAIKDYLLDKVTLLHIHRFDPNDLQFDDAIVSSCVVWFRKSEPSKKHTVRFTFGGTLAQPHVERWIPAEALRAEQKWTRFPAQDVRRFENVPRLADFFYIKRGLATGANEYFILNRKQIHAQSLPLEAFWPILPSPRYLDRDEITADAEGNPLIDRQLFLLNCRLSEEETKEIWPSLAHYLDKGRKDGIAERYLCQHRRPWYAQENRPAPPLVCTYLGRQSVRDGKPFRFILNHSRATVPNVYLALYPKPFLAKAFRENGELKRVIWRFLNSIPPEEVVGAGRVYGGGLHKLEPKELANIPVPELNTLLPFKAQIHYQPELLEAAE